MNFKYIFGSILSIPLLPVIYYQGKQIRKSVPKLPEAKAPIGLEDGGFDQTSKILFIGESTFAGVGAETHEEGFAGSFSKEFGALNKTNVQWRVYARSGYTLSRMRKKLLPKIEEKHADLILVGTGGNNAFTLSHPSKWRVQVVELIYDLQQKFPNTPIVFSNMPPIKMFPAFTQSIKFVIGNLVEVLGTELKDIVRTYDDVFYNDEVIKLKTWSKKLDRTVSIDELFSDGVHPSVFTYQVWGKEMAIFVSKLDC